MSGLLVRLGSALRVPLLVVLVAVAAFGVGAVFVHSTRDGVLVAAALGLAVAMLDQPAVVSVLALCAVFLGQRLGGDLSTGSGGMSYSDVTMAFATVLAIPTVLDKHVLGRLRLPLIGLGVYLALLLPTVLLHPTRTGYLEWAHRLVLVGGALLVGASIAQARSSTAALRILTIVAACYGVLTVLAGARHGFSSPAEPLGLNKNFIGALLGDVGVLALCAPKAVGLPRAVRIAALVPILGGLLASWSRGSMLAVAIGVYLAVMLSGQVVGRGRKVVALLLAVGLTYGAYLSINREFHEAPDKLKFNSVGARLSTEHEAHRVWLMSPIDGEGLKYFRTNCCGSVLAANNVIDNELAESGVIGAVGFVVLEGCVIWAGVRRRKGDQLVVAATGIVAGSLFHGMVDIYWIAGTCTLPYLLLGVALGRPPAEPEPSAAREPDESRVIGVAT